MILPGTNPFLFVVGCPRSGTTLLQRMLDHHPALAVTNDTHFIPRALQRAAPRMEPVATAGRRVPLGPALIDAVVGYHRFPRLGLDAADARRLAVGVDDYACWVARLYDRFAETRGKPLAGEKTPDYVRCLPLLHGLFPSARSLHIVRDGRDVALSTLEWAGPKKGPGRWELWAREPVGACALWWRHQVETGRTDARGLPADGHAEVRYDRLVADPETELRGVTRFLDLPYDPAMLRYHDGKATADPRKSAKSNWLPPTRGLRDWRQQMAPEDVALFEQIAGDTLVSLGFELGEPRLPALGVRKRAEGCLDWWDGFVARRRRKAIRRLEAYP